MELKIWWVAIYFVRSGTSAADEDIRLQLRDKTLQIHIFVSIQLEISNDTVLKSLLHGLEL